MGEGLQQAPAGWYADPKSSTQVRYWDGAGWTEHTGPLPSTPQPVTAPETAPEVRKSRRLRLALLLVACLVLVGCAAFGFFVFSISQQGERLDHESKTYVESLLPRVVSSWDQQALESEMSPEFVKITDPQQMDQFFKVFSTLGTLKSIDSVKGEAHVQANLGQPVQITAVYRCKATFQEAPADIEVALIKHENRWQVLGFRVNSEYFIEKLQ